MLLKEARIRQSEATEPLTTVYIGGGTPSLLPPSLLADMIRRIREVFSLDAVQEFTIEANPGTVTKEWIDTALSLGINRLSLGMQAYQGRLLSLLGRIHRFEDVVASVSAARSSGFGNIGIDLIFGIPTQTIDDWSQTVESVISLHPEHISAYGLIPEEGTPLAAQLESGSLELPDPDMERDMYDRCIRLLSENGFEQYEISNFSRSGFACRHNIGYWDQIPYLGLGVSAASMLRPSSLPEGFFSIRRSNPASFAEYYRMLRSPEDCGQEERITNPEARFETVMLSLRMTAGMNRSRFTDLHGAPPECFYGDILSRLAEQGLLVLQEDSWRLTRRGMDIQNSVLLEFMEDKV